MSDIIDDDEVWRARLKRLRITDEERQCLEDAIYRVAEHDNESDGWKSYTADTLRGLLERLGGER